ncbi:MAG: tetratricopeptide repeat protein [Vicinamibacteria bacterium]|nr:tetratricopeptide repeat protein [Vicinamibacteria bacterium]
MRLIHASWCLMVLLLCPPTATAHSDLHQQIVALTRAIAAAPTDARLYLQRGELHRAHHAPRQARADYDRALALDPSLDAARLARARLLVEIGQAAKAGPDLDVFLARHPGHVNATLVRARALRERGELAGAAADYDTVLAAAPDPDHGLERARLLGATGRDADRQQAVAGLDALMTSLGPIVTLELEAVALLATSGDYDDALARVERAIARSPRATVWRVRKADLLRQAGRTAEARQAYHDARVALDSSPPSRRQTPDAQRTRAAIDTALADLSATVQGSSHP